MLSGNEAPLRAASQFGVVTETESLRPGISAVRRMWRLDSTRVLDRMSALAILNDRYRAGLPSPKGRGQPSASKVQFGQNRPFTWLPRVPRKRSLQHAVLRLRVLGTLIRRL